MSENISKRSKAKTVKTENKVSQQLSADSAISVILLRDYWDHADVRHKKGEILDVDVVTARMLIAGEKARRIEPFLAKEIA